MGHFKEETVCPVATGARVSLGRRSPALSRGLTCGEKAEFTKIHIREQIGNPWEVDGRGHGKCLEGLAQGMNSGSHPPWLL